MTVKQSHKELTMILGWMRKNNPQVKFMGVNLKKEKIEFVLFSEN